MKRFAHRPSPATVLATIALLISLGGTAVAASHLVNGDRLIRIGTLSGNRLRRGTITGTQINMARLGQVPSAAIADTADNLPALNWVPLTLINGWNDLRAPDVRAPAIAVDAQGIVHLRGVIANSTGTSDTFAIAPQEFRPSQYVAVPDVLYNGVMGNVEIGPDGTMTVRPSAAGGYETLETSLDGVTYASG